jgi:hypothetical protein
MVPQTSAPCCHRPFFGEICRHRPPRKVVSSRNRDAAQECMSTAFWERLLQNLEFLWGEACLWSNTSLDLHLLPTSEAPHLSVAYAAAA